MTDDGPNYSNRIVRRRQFVPVVGVASAVLVTVSSCLLTHQLLALLNIPPTHPAAGFAMPIASAIGIAGGMGAGYAASRIHRSLWPEHPDEE